MKDETQELGIYEKNEMAPREDQRRPLTTSTPTTGVLIDEDIRRDMVEHPQGQDEQQQQQGQPEVQIINVVEVRIWKILAGNVADTRTKQYSESNQDS